MLRERGVLERTIRHELVHAMADGVLGKRPAWVREGAAIYFAGERPIPGQGRPVRPGARSLAQCPQDNELLQPVSAGALSRRVRARAVVLCATDRRRQELARRPVRDGEP